MNIAKGSKSWVLIPFIACIFFLVLFMFFIREVIGAIFLFISIVLFIKTIVLILFFRDLERLTVILTTLVFWFTPIIYPETMIPERYMKLILFFNPLSPLMISWRKLFLDGSLDLALVTVSFTYSLVVFMLGYLIYKKLSWKFAEVL